MDIGLIQIISFIAIILGASIKTVQTYINQGGEITIENIGGVAVALAASIAPSSIEAFNNFTIDSHLTLSAVIIAAFATGYAITTGSTYFFGKSKYALTKLKTKKQ